MSSERLTAEPGAPVAPGRVALSQPVLAGREWELVKECIDTGWVSSVGPFVERFERLLASRVGASRGVAVINGTAAIHTALMAAGVGPGDAVLVSTLSFIAPANAVRYVGARPVLIDAEPGTWQMDPLLIDKFCRDRCFADGNTLRIRETGERLKAILPVHILGHPVDLDPICRIARQYGLTVVEDATESLGAAYKGRPVGSLGDVACFSFNGNKVMTTGGGGVIVTNDPDLAERARYLSTQAKDDPIEYVHGAVGYNYRLSNVLAAIGCAQLEQLDGFLNARRLIADRYRAAFAGREDVSFMPTASWASPTYWLSTILLGENTESRALMRRLDAVGIQTRPLWQPLHLSPALAPAIAEGGAVAESLQRRALHLPSSADLSEADQARVVAAVCRYLDES
jgi:perosamine synthetase